MQRGYVKVWRKIEDSGLIQIPNTLALFMYILLNATYKDRKVGTPTGVVELKRGQYISGRIELAKKLKQTEQQIRTSLKRLEELQILTSKSTNRYSVYTIENYSKYQDENEDATNNLTSKQPANNQQTTTKQTLKHLSIKEFKPYSAEFERFWRAYPRKEKKKDAFEAWCESKNSPDIEIVMKALYWQVDTRQWRKNDGQYVPLPTTYINGWYWNNEPPDDGLADWYGNQNIEKDVTNG